MLVPCILYFFILFCTITKNKVHIKHTELKNTQRTKIVGNTTIKRSGDVLNFHFFSKYSQFRKFAIFVFVSSHIWVQRFLFILFCFIFVFLWVSVVAAAHIEKKNNKKQKHWNTTEFAKIIKINTEIFNVTAIFESKQ